jgi:hypothetical protein
LSVANGGVNVNYYEWQYVAGGAGWVNAPTSFPPNNTSTQLPLTAPPVKGAGIDNYVTYKVRYINSCDLTNSSLYSPDFTVYLVEPPLEPSVVPPGDLCSGELATFRLQNWEPGVTYAWSVNSGGASGVTWSPTTGTAGPPNYTFTTTPTLIGTTTTAINPIITITASNGVCSSTSTITASSMTIWPTTIIQPVKVTQTTSEGVQFTCEGKTYTYSITPATTNSNLNYTWTVPDDWEILSTTTVPAGGGTIAAGGTSASGMGLRSITVKAGDLEGFVAVSASNACGGYVRLQWPVIPITEQISVDLYVPNQICFKDAISGEILQILASTDAPGGAIYTWTLPSSMEAVTAAGAPTTLGNGDMIYVRFRSATPPIAGQKFTIGVKASIASCTDNFAETSEEIEVMAHFNVETGIDVTDVTVCSPATGLNINLRNLVKLTDPSQSGHTEFIFWRLEGSDYIQMSNLLITSLSGTTTFYVSVSNHDYCESERRPITITVLTAPPPSVSIALTDGSNTICAGTSVTFTATPTNGGVTPSYQWKINGINEGAPTIYNTLTITLAAGTHSVTCEMISNAMCVDPTPVASNAISITVKAYPTAANLTGPNSTTICKGESIKLTATSTGVTNPVYTWYDEAMVSITTGDELTTGALTTTTIYYVSVQGDGHCETPESIRREVTVTVNPIATAGNLTAPNDVTICSGDPVTLTATSTGVTAPVYTWYDETMQFIQDGATLSESALTTTTTYYVSVKGTGLCETPEDERREVSVTVTPNANASHLTGPNSATICSGEAITLTATSNGVTNPVYTWYNSSMGFIQTGATFPTGALTVTTTYYVSVKGDGLCETPAAARRAVTVTVNPNANAFHLTGPNSATICSGESVDLTAASNGVTNPVYTWYNSAMEFIQTGETFSTGALTTTTSYYVSVQGDTHCETPESIRRKVTVIINAIPSFTASDDCYAGKGEITVSPLGSGYVYALLGGGFDGTSFSANNVFTGLENGNYFVIVKNTFTECTATSSTQIVIDCPSCETPEINIIEKGKQD